MDKKTTHFGYQEVAEEDKAKKVAGVFRSGGAALRPDERSDVGECTGCGSASRCR